MRGIAADINRRRLSVRCRMAPAGRSAPRCWVRMFRRRRTLPESRQPSSGTAWTCCRQPIPGLASRSRSGTCSAECAASRSTGFSAMTVPIRSCPMPRSSSATRAQETLELCRAARNAGFRAVKCGWGPFGRGSLQEDADQLAAAREGLGPDGMLLIDAGQIWVEDVAAAEARLPLLEACQRRPGWRSRSTAAPTRPMVRSPARPDR